MKKLLQKIVPVLSICILGTGCALTHQSRSVETKGFLKNYEQLQKGEKGQAHLVYINPNTDFKKYSKIYIAPIQAWSSKDSGLSGLDKKDIQALVNYLRATVVKELSTDYDLVKQPEPGAFTLKMAITDAEGSNVPLDIISHALPVGMAISVIKRVAVGAHSSVGKAAIEVEAVDSLTNERLGAFVDARVGALRVRDMHKKWSDPQSSFDYWAKKMKSRLAELRSK